MKKQVRTTFVIDEEMQKVIAELIENGMNISFICRKALKAAHSGLTKTDDKVEGTDEV